MPLKLHIIAAALPPQLDGIGDYTACLAAELALSADVTVLTAAAHPDPIPGVRIETAFSADDPSSVRQIACFVGTGKPDWVLLQYNPFSYGRWGLNLHLPEMLRGLRRVSPGTRLAVMVHEPFVPVITPQFATMASWQRWQLWRIGRSADIVFFAIDFCTRQFRSWFGDKPLVHLPVGSNIPCLGVGRPEARARLGIRDDRIVVGLFGSAGGGRMRHHTQRALQTLGAAGRSALLLYIGPDSAEICVAFGSEDVIAGGPYPAEEVSRRLSAVDVYVAAYEDGVSTRRGAFMAALQHGIAVVGTRGRLTDAVLEREAGRAFELADASDLSGFAAAVTRLAADAECRERLGQEARQLYRQEFDWDRGACRLLSSLKVVETRTP